MTSKNNTHGTKNTKRGQKHLNTEHLRYIKREAEACVEQKIAALKANTNNALQVFDDHAVMIRLAELLDSREGYDAWRILREQLLKRLRSGNLSAKHNVIGLDLSVLPQLQRLRSEFESAREVITTAYEQGAEVIRAEVRAVVDRAYMSDMPSACTKAIMDLRGLELPELPTPAVM